MSRSDDSRPKVLLDLSHIARSISSLLFSASAWLPEEKLALDLAGAVREHLEKAACLIEARAMEHREFIRQSDDRVDEFVAVEIAGLRASLKGVRYSGFDESFIGERTRAFHGWQSDNDAEKAIAEMPPIDIDGFKLDLAAQHRLITQAHLRDIIERGKPLAAEREVETWLIEGAEVEKGPICCYLHKVAGGRQEVIIRRPRRPF